MWMSTVPRQDRFSDIQNQSDPFYLLSSVMKEGRIACVRFWSGRWHTTQRWIVNDDLAVAAIEKSLCGC